MRGTWVKPSVQLNIFEAEKSRIKTPLISFKNAISVSKKCKNFYLVAVISEELKRRMEDDRLVDSRFDIVKLLEDPKHRDSFFNELFHHTLRII